MKVAELVALLRVDDAQFRQGLDRARSEFQSMGDRLESTGKTLTKNLTTPIVGFGALAIKTAMDFETAMLKVKAVTGANQTEFTKLTDLAKELGRTTNFSATQAAEAMNFLAMAGLSTNEVMGALPGVLDLASAAGMDLAETADIATNILSGMGFEVDQLARVNDVLAKTMTNSNTDMQQLGQAMKYAAPLVAAAKVEFEEAAAVLGMMGNAGIQADMAGTSLRGAITRLLEPTKQVSDRLKALGVNVRDSNGELLPLVDIFRQLEKAGADAGDMMTIFGMRAGPAMMAVMSQGSTALAEFTQKNREAAGTTKEMVNIMTSGAQGAFTRMKSAFEGLLIAIAESGLLDAFASVADWLAKIFEALARTDSGILNTIIVIAMLAAAVGPVLFAVGKLINIYGTVFTTALSIARSQMVVTAATHVASAARIVAGWVLMGTQSLLHAARMAAAWVIAMGPVGWIIAAVVALVALIIANWDTVVEWTSAAWDAVVGALEAAWNWIVDIVTTAWNAVIEFLQPAIDVVVNIFRYGIAIILAIFFALAEFFGWIWEQIWSIIGPPIQAIWDFIVMVWNAIVDGVTAANEAIMEAITAAWEAVWGFLQPIVQAIWDFLVAAWETVSGVIGDVMSAIWDVISSVWNTIAGFFSDVWSKISGVVGDGVGKVWSILTDLWNRIMGVAGEAIGWLVDAGKNIIQGLWNGIASMGQWLWDQIMNFVRRYVPAPVLEFLGIASPSKLFASMGREIPAGLGQGILAGAEVASTAARRMAAEVSAAGMSSTLDVTASLAGAGFAGASAALTPRGSDGPSAADLAAAVGTAVHSALDGARMEVDGRGVARLVNRSNLLDRRRSITAVI